MYLISRTYLRTLFSFNYQLCWIKFLSIIKSFFYTHFGKRFIFFIYFVLFVLISYYFLKLSLSLSTLSSLEYLIIISNYVGMLSMRAPAIFFLPSDLAPCVQTPSSRTAYRVFSKMNQWIRFTIYKFFVDVPLTISRIHLHNLHTKIIEISSTFQQIHKFSKIIRTKSCHSINPKTQTVQKTRLYLDKLNLQFN